MSAEINDLAKEYDNLVGALDGFTHSQSLDDEFQRMREIEDHLLTTGNILASENLLQGKDVFIMQGDGGESSEYYSGEVEEIFSDLKGNPTAILLKDGTEIPFHPNITHVSIIRKN